MHIKKIIVNDILQEDPWENFGKGGGPQICSALQRTQIDIHLFFGVDFELPFLGFLCLVIQRPLNFGV